MNLHEIHTNTKKHPLCLHTPIAPYGALVQSRFCCEIAVGKLDANGGVLFDAIRNVRPALRS